jgi:Predicted glycosyltransferases
MIKKEYPEVRIIRNEESIGFGGGNNQAFALARGEYIMILEPDTLIKSDNAISMLVKYLRTHPDVGAVAPKLILVKNGKVQRSAFLRFPSLLTFAFEWFPLNEAINKLFPRFDHCGNTIVIYHN